MPHGNDVEGTDPGDGAARQMEEPEDEQGEGWRGLGGAGLRGGEAAVGWAVTQFPCPGAVRTPCLMQTAETVRRFRDGWLGSPRREILFPSRSHVPLKSVRTG